MLYYAACAQKKIVPERPVSRRLMSALVSSHVMAFMACNGCRKITLGDSSGLEEKIERILSIKPDVIHVGICCKTRTDDNEYCPEALRLVDIFHNHGIEIVWGTHSDTTRHPRKFTYE